MGSSAEKSGLCPPFLRGRPGCKPFIVGFQKSAGMAESKLVNYSMTLIEGLHI